jgi:hypothetical protein
MVGRDRLRTGLLDLAVLENHHVLEKTILQF